MEVYDELGQGGHPVLPLLSWVSFVANLGPSAFAPTQGFGAQEALLPQSVLIASGGAKGYLVCLLTFRHLKFAAKSFAWPPVSVDCPRNMFWFSAYFFQQV